MTSKLNESSRSSAVAAVCVQPCMERLKEALRGLFIQMTEKQSFAGFLDCGVLIDCGVYRILPPYLVGTCGVSGLMIVMNQHRSDHSCHIHMEYCKIELYFASASTVHRSGKYMNYVTMRPRLSYMMPLSKSTAPQSELSRCSSVLSRDANLLKQVGHRVLGAARSDFARVV